MTYWLLDIEKYHAWRFVGIHCGKWDSVKSSNPEFWSFRIIKGQFGITLHLHAKKASAESGIQKTLFDRREFYPWTTDARKYYLKLLRIVFIAHFFYLSLILKIWTWFLKLGFIWLFLSTILLSQATENF